MLMTPKQSFVDELLTDTDKPTETEAKSKDVEKEEELPF